MNATNHDARSSIDAAGMAALCAQHSREVQLPDGATLLIRPLRSDDRQREAAFIEALSPTSRYMRLMTPLRFLTPHLLDQLMDIDYRTRMAFVATTREAGEEKIIGVARYARAEDDKTIELGITVTDAWQRRGVARTLLETLLTYARAQGFERASSIVLADNTRMLDLARGSGAHLALMPGEGLMRVDFPLTRMF